MTAARHHSRVATTVTRYDRGTLRPPRKSAEGWRVDGHASRAGVLEYSDPTRADGVRRELRLPEDVFEEESLASFEGRALTNDHPNEDVTTDNWRDMVAAGRVVGTVLGRGNRDGDHVAVAFAIHDRDGVDAVRRGKRELSVGYSVELDERPGVHPKYGRYDVRQRKIRVNHLAIVDRGRAGPTAAMRADSSALVEIRRGDLRASTAVSPLRKKDTMDPNLEAMNKLHQELGAERAARAKAEKERDDALAKLKDFEPKLATAESEAKDQKAKADAADKARRDAISTARADARRRVDLEARATAILGADSLETDDGKGGKVEKTDRALQVEIVKKLDGDDIAVERSDEYVAARYDGAVRRVDAEAKRADESRGAVRGDIAAGRARVPAKQAKKLDSEEEAARKRDDENRDAWLPKRAPAGE